jgi:hypothetical protein
METPEEREYTRYLTEIEARKRRVAVLSVELQALKIDLARFEAEYHARIGALFVDLDRLRLAIDEYERRIVRLQEDPTADPTDIERDLGREFGARREGVRAEEEEARGYEDAYRRERQRPRLSAEAETDIKRLYRDLARRFHPDLARTEEERRRREMVMQRVNAAFRERDLRTLEAISREEEIADPAFEVRSIGEKLIWAIREVARLDELIEGLEADLAAARATDTHQLWRRQVDGDAVIEHLEADLKREVAAERDRLATLVGVYRHLIDRRVA